MTRSAKSAAFLCTVLSLTACADEPRPRGAPTPPTTAATQILERKPIDAPALTSAAPSTLRSILEPAKAPSTLREQAEALQKLEPPAEKTVDAKDEGPGAAKDVRVDRFVLSRGIEDREPIDEGETFSTDDDGIFAFVQLANDHGSPTEVFVHFEKATDPPLPYGIALQVPNAKRWRTWAVTRVKREPGSYRVVLRTADGNDLATKSFEVVASD